MLAEGREEGGEGASRDKAEVQASLITHSPTSRPEETASSHEGATTRVVGVMGGEEGASQAGGGEE